MDSKVRHGSTQTICTGESIPLGAANELVPLSRAQGPAVVRAALRILGARLRHVERRNIVGGMLREFDATHIDLTRE